MLKSKCNTYHHAKYYILIISGLYAKPLQSMDKKILTLTYQIRPPTTVTKANHFNG